jgi:hypothetical protein
MRPENSAEVGSYYKPAFADSAKTGALCGLVGAWAIFGMILAVGGQLGLPPGTFYQMVGLSIGVDQEWPAIYLGFALHMVTGAVIGVIYMIVSDRVKQLRTDISTLRAFATGVATGVATWAVLFLPLHFLVMQPTLESVYASSVPGSTIYLTAEKLTQVSDSVLLGSLGIHVAFGSVMGFIARIATSSRQT